MLASEYVKILQELIDQHGDLEVASPNTEGQMEYKCDPDPCFIKKEIKDEIYDYGVLKIQNLFPCVKRSF